MNISLEEKSLIESAQALFEDASIEQLDKTEAKQFMFELLCNALEEHMAYNMSEKETYYLLKEVERLAE